MKRMLMLASVATMIGQFNMENIALLQEMGIEVDVACNFDGPWSREKIERLKEQLAEKNINYYQMEFSRNVFKVANHKKSYQQLVNLLKERKYDFIHCHTPIAGAIGRMAGHKCGVKVMYTAHGFHFFKGGPLLNWCIFYPIEKFLSKWTDVLITINHEDFARAKTFQAKRVEYIPGVGINDTPEIIENVEDIRNEFHMPQNAKIILSVGELNKNKNHEVVIRALKYVKNKDVHYIICGIGDLQESLKKIAQECDVEERVHFAGYRLDIQKFYALADVFVFPSYREGLSVALMEALSYGLPVVCSKIRGNTDLVQEGKGGYFIEPADEKMTAKWIDKLLKDLELRENMKKYNQEICKKYSKEIIKKEMKRIYQEILK